jgi:hypothetical protein
MSKMISQKQAKSLAVVYNAWQETGIDDINGQIVWGQMLLKKQHDTGINLIPNSLLESITARAKRTQGESL